MKKKENEQSGAFERLPYDKILQFSQRGCILDVW